MTNRRTPELPLLIVAVVGIIVVHIFLDSTLLRVALGLVAVALIVWSSVRLGLKSREGRAGSTGFNQRRFLMLRSQVQQLLEEIRRLNWLAVDAERGVREPEKFRKEREAIQARLGGILARIMEVAGKASQEGESESALGDAPADSDQ